MNLKKDVRKQIEIKHSPLNGKEKEEYIPPEVISYSSEEILEVLGPATACVTPVFGPGRPQKNKDGFF